MQLAPQLLENYALTPKLSRITNGPPRFLKITDLSSASLRINLIWYLSHWCPISFPFSPLHFGLHVENNHLKIKIMIRVPNGVSTQQTLHFPPMFGLAFKREGGQSNLVLFRTRHSFNNFSICIIHSSAASGSGPPLNFGGWAWWTSPIV